MKKEFTEFSVLCCLDLRVAWFYSLAIIKRKSHRSDYTNACLCCAVVACLSPISHFIIPLLCWVSEGCTLPPCVSVPGVPGQLAPSWLGPWEALVRDQRWEERSYKIFLSSSLATSLGVAGFYPWLQLLGDRSAVFPGSSGCPMPWLWEHCFSPPPSLQQGVAAASCYWESLKLPYCALCDISTLLSFG